jgi:hypothetical protein
LAGWVPGYLEQPVGSGWAPCGKAGLIQLGRQIIDRVISEPDRVGAKLYDVVALRLSYFCETRTVCHFVVSDICQAFAKSVAEA